MSQSKILTCHSDSVYGVNGKYTKFFSSAYRCIAYVSTLTADSIRGIRIFRHTHPIIFRYIFTHKNKASAYARMSTKKYSYT